VTNSTTTHFHEDSCGMVNHKETSELITFQNQMFNKMQSLGKSTTADEVAKLTTAQSAYMETY